MASLWNLVTRLTSKRRLETQLSLQNDLGTQEHAAEPEIAEVVSDDETHADPQQPSEDVSAQPFGSDIPVERVPALGSTHADASIAVTSEVQAGLPAPRTPARRSKKDSAGIEVASLQPVPVPSPSDQLVSLDGEIKLLRGQLIGKLQQQNAQLKKMLERFDR